MPVPKNAKWCNNGLQQKMLKECPAGWHLGRIRTGKPAWNSGLTKEDHPSLKKMSIARSGRPSNTKGKKLNLSEEQRKNLSERAKARGGFSHIDNTGKEPWNKGLSIPNLTKGQKRPHGNYPSGEDHPNWNPNSEDLEDYRRRVRHLTEKTYKQNTKKINPNLYKRVRAGNDGYQLDHIVSISEAYVLGWPPEKTSSVENLQMLDWRENIIKGGANKE